jgi:hypothetical protein
MGIEVEVLKDVTDSDLAAINRLLPQLSRSAPPLDSTAVRRIATWDGSSLLAARSAGEIIGILTLITFPIPTGVRAWIEDVVVDETTRPTRESAGRLYERLGFSLRDTRVYRLAGEP